jgi:cupin fold WbuC family metalloprotein
MKIVNNEKILQLGNEALLSPRKRMNLNLHSNAADPLQRMVNVLEPGTYLRPHMHKDPEKREVFVILRGSLLVCLFDDKGEIIHHVVLDKDEGNYIIEISPSTWHTILPLAVHTAVFECKDGPYDPETDKLFAQWAPEEGAPEALEFNKQLLKKLDFIFPEFL